MIDMPELVRRLMTEDFLELLLFIGVTCSLKKIHYRNYSKFHPKKIALFSIFFFQVGFRIQGNVDMFPHRESPRIFKVPRHSEIFPLEVSSSGNSHSGVRTGFICEVGRAEGFGVKKNGLFHAVEREASMDLEHVASNLFYFSTLKKNMGIFLHVEKIGTSEMVVSGFNAGENARRIYLNLHGCTGYIRWVKVNKTGDFIELTVDVVYHHVAH
jgi:hypothetical protein